MGYQEAAQVISEEGAHGGDLDLKHEEYARSDRNNRILDAVDDLRDLVFESFLDENYKLQIDFKHIDKIASLIAQGMMVQYEHDQKELGVDMYDDDDGEYEPLPDKLAA
jgi:hypothetical protein